MRKKENRFVEDLSVQPTKYYKEQLAIYKYKDKATSVVAIVPK